MNLSLAALFLRSRAARRAALPLLVAGVLAWTVLHVLVAVQMSPEQRVQETMGTADGTTEVPQQVLAGSDVAVPFRPAGVDDVVPSVTAVPSWVGIPERMVMKELAFPSAASEGRFELLDGRPPRAPGEVLLTPRARELFRDAPPQPVLGQLSLTVVGTVREVFSTGSAAIVAAPGTWDTWDVDQREAQLAGELAQVTLYWRADDPDRTAAAYAAHYDDPGESLDFPAATTRAALDAQLNALGIGRISRILLSYGVPVAAVLMVGGWLAGALGARIGSRILRPLRDVGVSSAMLSGTLVVTLLGVSAALVAAAALGTYGLLLAVRPVISLFLDHPVRPWEWSGVAVLGTALLGLLASVAGSWAGMRRRRRGAERRPRLVVNRRAEMWLRWAAAPVIALGILAATSAGQTYSAMAQVVICISVAVCLFTPTVLRIVSGIRVVPGATLGALRFTSTRLSSLGAYTALVVLLVSVSASTLAVVGSTTANLNATNSRLAPPGIAFTGGVGGQPPAAEMVTKFERDVGVGNPVTVWESADLRPDDVIMTWAFGTEDDAATVLGPLDAPLRAALAAGPVPTAVEPRAGATTPLLIVPREFDYIDFVALQPGRPVTAETTVRGFYTGLTPEQDAAASGWNRTNGISSFATAHTEPEPIPIPTGIQLSAGGFGLVIALIAYFLLRAEAATYRPLLAGLNAVGLGRRWLLRMLVVVGGMVGIVCAAAGLLAVLVNLVLVSHLLPDSVYIAGAPWLAIVVMLGASVLGAVIGAAFAARGLHARERKV